MGLSLATRETTADDTGQVTRTVIATAADDQGLITLVVSVGDTVLGSAQLRGWLRG